MQNYLKHLQQVSNSQTFSRKIDYIRHNYSKFIPDKNKKNYAVLEIGPGTGEFIAYLNGKGLSNIDIADLDKSVIDYISSRFEINNKILSENLATSRKLRKYDIILMLQVFEHIPREQYKSLLKSLHRALKPYGKLIMTVPNGGNPLNLLERYHDLQHENAFTEDSLRELPNYCGVEFASICVEPFAIPPYSLINIIRIVLQKILHLIIVGLIALNGGVYQKIMTPNITVVFTKGNK